MTSVNGSTRYLLLGSLVLSGMILVGSFYLLLGDDDVDPRFDTPTEDDVVSEVASGAPEPGRRRNGGSDDARDRDDEGFFVGEGGERIPWGEAVEWSPEMLAAAIDDWLENPGTSDVMRQTIDKLQNHEPPIAIPPELVARIVEKLDSKELWRDAVLTLGMLTDDASGTLLADLAVNPNTPEEVRLHALEALAASGQAAGISQILALVETAELSRGMVRMSARALGAMGGPEASRVLVDLLVRYQDDDASGAIMTAVAQAEGAGPALTELLRKARSENDDGLAKVVVGVAMRQGTDAAPELRREVLLVAQDPTVAIGGTDDVARQRLKLNAINALAHMGEIDEVLRLAENDTDGLAPAYYHTLRNARGDDAAEKIVAALERTTERRSQYELVTAAGETGSRKVTPTLLAKLDAEESSVREAAAIALKKVADPGAAKALVERLDEKDHPYHIRRELVDALGVMNNKSALEKLRQWRDSGDAKWQDVMPHLRRAIERIESGDPATTRMK